MKSILSNNYINSIASKFVLVILGIVSSILINRYLGPEGRGEYAYILNILNIFALFLNLGIYQSYPNYKRNKPSDSANTYYSIFIVQFIIYTGFSLLIASIIGFTMYFIPALLLPVMILANQLRFMSLIENVNKRNLTNVFNQLGYIIILIIMFFYFPSNYEYALFALLLKDFLIIANFTKKYNYRFYKNLLSIEDIVYSIKFGFLPMLSSLLITLNYKLDIIILKYFVDFQEIGLYSVGVSLANQVWIIPDAFKDVIFSRVARKDSTDGIILSIKINLYISVLIIAGIIIYGKKIITLLYGKEYLMSYDIVIIIFIGIIPMIFFKLINPILIVKGKQKIAFYTLCISVAINTIMNFMLIPLHGIVGAAIASVFSYSICGLVFLVVFARDYNIKIARFFVLNKAEISKILKAFGR